MENTNITIENRFDKNALTYATNLPHTVHTYVCIYLAGNKAYSFLHSKHIVIKTKQTLNKGYKIRITHCASCQLNILLCDLSFQIFGD